MEPTVLNLGSAYARLAWPAHFNVLNFNRLFVKHNRFIGY